MWLPSELLVSENDYCKNHSLYVLKTALLSFSEVGSRALRKVLQLATVLLCCGVAILLSVLLVGWFGTLCFLNVAGTRVNMGLSTATALSASCGCTADRASPRGAAFLTAG